MKSYEHIRIADMSKGKANDDSYRGVHVYYQASNYHYPIEIQYNTFYDRQLNNWFIVVQLSRQKSKTFIMN